MPRLPIVLKLLVVFASTLGAAPPIAIPQTPQEVEVLAKEAEMDLDKAEEALKKSPQDFITAHNLMEDCFFKTFFLESMTMSSILVPSVVKETAAKFVVQIKARYMAFLSTLPKLSLARPLFSCVRGTAPVKSLPADRKITTLNWNVCCFAGNLSLFFGGVRPWTERMDGIVQQIIDLNPDIVCLQEVFSEVAIDALYRGLKSNFAYFYLHIGPKEYSFDLEKLRRIPSGLFVASKYPLDEPFFYPYNVSKNETEPTRGYGFFMGNLFNRVCICTTHLQPGDEEKDREIRNNQLTAINEHTPKGHSTCIFADLNIEYGSDEYKKSVESRFVNHYKGGKNEWTCCELKDAWFNPEQYSKSLLQGSLPLQRIDAVLEIRRIKKLALGVKCQVVPLVRLDEPKNALSDHNPLFVTITLPK